MSCGRTTSTYSTGDREAIYYPLPGRQTATVTAVVDAPLLAQEKWKVMVSWFSIGLVTPDDARKFAAAIIEAADWCDQQEVPK